MKEKRTLAGEVGSSAVSGGAAGIFTEILFYGLDSYKVQTQAGKSIQIKTMFRGAVPVAVLGTVITVCSRITSTTLLIVSMYSV